MRVVVVGAGAWGLPTAAELVRRGHEVTLLDRYPPGNPWASSGGPTRLWRTADPDPAAIRLGRRTLGALGRLEARAGRRLHTAPGLLWRDADASLQQITDAVATEGVAHVPVPAAEVGAFFPGLVPDDRDALWFPEAGSLLSADLIEACLRLFHEGGGTSVVGRQAVSVRTTAGGAAVTLEDGAHLEADRVVVCAGPGTAPLLADLGLDVPLQPFLEQVVHLGVPADLHGSDDLPCLFDGPGGHGPGIYSMPTPGVGYKVGIDDPLRELLPDDLDREPDPLRTRDIVERADQILPVPGRVVVDELVCCWTDSPDGWFVIESLDAVVVACGDAGKGFKYAPAVGEILADLAEGAAPDADVSAMSARRFKGLSRGSTWSPTSLGGARG